MAGIQQFISESRKGRSAMALQSVEQDTVQPIVIAEDFAFGFEDYAQEAMPDSASAILFLDKAPNIRICDQSSSSRKSSQHRFCRT